MPKYLAISNKGYTFAPANEKEVALLAQLVEQLTLNQWVQGSTLRVYFGGSLRGKFDNL